MRMKGRGLSGMRAMANRLRDERLASKGRNGRAQDAPDTPATTSTDPVVMMARLRQILDEEMPGLSGAVRLGLGVEAWESGTLSARDPKNYNLTCHIYIHHLEIISPGLGPVMGVIGTWPSVTEQFRRQLGDIKKSVAERW